MTDTPREEPQQARAEYQPPLVEDIPVDAGTAVTAPGTSSGNRILLVAGG